MLSLAPFLAYADAQVGKQYRPIAGRCEPHITGYADCSGLVVGALRASGTPMDCTGSFALAQWCYYQGGRRVTLEYARSHPGCLLFKGINGGMGGRPGYDPGHVAISRTATTTTEARNSFYDICHGPLDGRAWDGIYTMPGYDYTVYEKPKPPKVPQLVPAWDGEEDARMYSDIANTDKGEDPRVAKVATDERMILLAEGAQISNTKGGARLPNETAFGLRFFRLPGTSKVYGHEPMQRVGVDPRNGETKILTYGIRFRFWDGTFKPYYFTK